MRTLTNYLGKKYNNLTILDLDHKYKTASGRWVYKMRCLCDCGGETSVDLKELKRGGTKSCGCLSKSLEKPVVPGEVVNIFKVLKEAEPSIDTKTGDISKRVHVECIECGHKKTIGWYYLRTRKSNKCTCPKRKPPKVKKEPKNFVGYTSGKYKVVEQYEWDKPSKSRKVKIKCECGTERITNMRYLKRNKPQGCAKCAGTKTHGLTNHPLHSKWKGIIGRCENSKINMYYRYGGRGIKICQQWREDFKKFYDWSIENGWEEGLEIDRIDPDGDYEPNNCRYVTQEYNKRHSSQAKLDWDKVNFIRENKDTMTSRELADMYGVGTSAIRDVILNKTWTS